MSPCREYDHPESSKCSFIQTDKSKTTTINIFAISLNVRQKFTLLPRANITLLRLDKEVLIFLVSSSRWPVEPESFSLSDPAKSTKFRLPTQFSPVLAFDPWIFSINTECDRELLSLQLVAATARAFLALRKRLSTFFPSVTSSV